MNASLSIVRTDPFLVVTNAVGGSSGLGMGFFGTNSLTLRLFRPYDFPDAADGFLVLRRTSVEPGLWSLGGGLSAYPHVPDEVYDNFFRANNNTGAGTLTTMSWHLYNPLSTTTGWSSRVNGTTAFIYAGAGHIYGGVPPSRVLAPANSAGNRLVGQMAEFMIFDRALTSDERTTVEKYLNRRYSLW